MLKKSLILNRKSLAHIHTAEYCWESLKTKTNSNKDLIRNSVHNHSSKSFHYSRQLNAIEILVICHLVDVYCDGHTYAPSLLDSLPMFFLFELCPRSYHMTQHIESWSTCGQCKLKSCLRHFPIISCPLSILIKAPKILHWKKVRLHLEWNTNILHTVH